MYELDFLPEAIKERKKLDKSIRLEFKKQLLEIQQSPDVVGFRLKGDLRDCHRIKAPRSGYRLIYRIKANALVIVVIAVGKRENEEAYKVALDRIMEMMRFSEDEKE